MKNYFRSFFYCVFVLWIMGICVSTIFAFSAGPPNGRTGSPADNFKTCKDTGCHNSFELNSGKATVSISAPDNYALSEVVPITISFSNSSTAKHGFELSALDANDEHVGTFSPVDGKTQTDDRKENYIKHTSTGSNQSGNASWGVTWTAPPSAVKNPVTFYAAGNEANGDGTHDGDYIYTTTREISQLATPTPAPTATATPFPTPTPTNTVTPMSTPTPTPIPTPAECEAESMTASPGELEFEKGESVEVVVTLIPAGGCSPDDGELVTAKVNRSGKKRVSVSPESATTNVNGEAMFTITASNKAGKAKVKFRYKDLKTTVKVKVVK
ncbi:MAG: hypothetical protein NG747_05000 [Candidatus Brocadia sp.]|nr:hypothetical protein [Candidatus Brocadia sp.]